MGKRNLEHLDVVQLKAHAQENADVVGSAVAVGPCHGAIAIYDVSAVGGDANETLTPKVEGRKDGGAWQDALDTGESYGVVTQPNGAQVVAVRLKPFEDYRVNDLLAGTSPLFTYGVHLVAYKPDASVTLPAAS